MHLSPKGIASGAAALAVASGAFAILAAPTTALAPGVDHRAGPAQVVTPADANPQFAPITSGSSSTKFTLKLPQGAACTQDSANFGYRVQTYMVPASVDPNTLTFDDTGPIGPLRPDGQNTYQPLFDEFTSRYVNGQTANADPPGGPGFIINLPAFNYRVFPAGFITPGDYNIGVACTLGQPGPSQLDKFWNVQKTFTADPSAGTSEVSFVVIGVNPPTSSTSSTLPTSSSTSSSSTLPTSSSTSSTLPTSSSTSSTLPTSSSTSSSTTRPTSSSTSSSTTRPTSSTTMVPPTEPDCRGLQATIVGTPGDDDITGTPGADVIVGLGGNDRILGLGGADTICGGGGDDRLVGGSGGDLIIGGEGVDYIVGDAGPDVLVGSDGDDRIRGGTGDDKLDGKDGDDECRAGAGTDTVLNCEF